MFCSHIHPQHQVVWSQCGHQNIRNSGTQRRAEPECRISGRYCGMWISCTEQLLYKIYLACVDIPFVLAKVCSVVLYMTLEVFDESFIKWSLHFNNGKWKKRQCWKHQRSEFEKFSVCSKVWISTCCVRYLGCSLQTLALTSHDSNSEFIKPWNTIWTIYVRRERI